ncbi:MAG: hypothetical protein U0451_00480 [Candidatus Saccharimonadales bacterium]
MQIRPVGEITEEGFGRYEPVDGSLQGQELEVGHEAGVAPDLDGPRELAVEVSGFSGQSAELEPGIRRASRETRVPNNERSSIRERARSVWRFTKVVGLTAGALLVAREIHDFGFDFDAEQKAEITVDAADNSIRENVYVNLAEVSSTFPLEVKTSLNRFGPSNCDMNISMNKKDHEVTTVTNTGVIFDVVDVNPVTEDGIYKYEIDVEGDMEMTPSSVDWTKTPILFDQELKGLDTCFDMNEVNSAMNLAVVTTQQAGQLATACAIDSKEGEEVIIDGIKEDAKNHGDIPENVPNDKIKVNFPGLDDQQDAAYGRTVQEFDTVTGKVIDDYIDASPDNHKVKTNFDGIKNCKKHTFKFGNQTSSSNEKVDEEN